MRLGVIAVLAAVCLPGTAQNRKPDDWRKQVKSGATLGQIRGALLKQRVIVAGPVVDLHGSVQLLRWSYAHEEIGDRYGAGRSALGAQSSLVERAVNALDNLPASYKGKAATVIEVQLNYLKLRDLRQNALGETISDLDLVDPYFDVVVRFDDAALGMTTAYPSAIGSNLEIALSAAALSEAMAKELPILIGSTVYADGYSTLYRIDTSLEDIIGVGSKQGILKQLSPADVPLLEPLSITAAKYIDLTGVVFRLKLPSGRDALSFTDQLHYVEGDDDGPLSRRVLGALLAEIPKTLTAEDLDAIRHRAIYKGMGKDALAYGLGSAERENDWGQGGKQRIYYSGRLVVYLDNNDRVVDWQSFDKP